MSRIIKKGATSQSVYVEVLDSTSTTGGRKTGLAYNTASLTAYYARNGAAAVAITLATLASASASWSSGGFVEVDATNMPGVYRLDVPNAAFASGADSVVITLKGATGMVQVSSEVQLVAVDLQDAAAAGMTNLDAAVSSRLATSGYTAPLDAAGTRSAVGLASANLDTQLTAIDDYLDTEVAAIKAKTDNLPASPASTGDVTGLLATQLADAYAANGVAPTLQQALMAIHQHLMCFGISGTSRTVKKLDGSTTAFTETLDSATAPTALTRA